MAFGKKTHICGFMSSTRIDDVLDNVFHKPSRLNSTFGGNLVDMVRFTRIMEIIEEERLVENAQVQGEFMLRELNAMEAEFPALVSNVRGRGMMCAIDLDSAQNRDQLRQKASRGRVDHHRVRRPFHSFQAAAHHSTWRTGRGFYNNAEGSSRAERRRILETENYGDYHKNNCRQGVAPQPGIRAEDARRLCAGSNS